MSRALARTFLLERLGLKGPLWPAGEAGRRAVGLGMIQIDSIRVTGLRNHEIAWAARTDAPVVRLYDLFYRERAMLETHYPLFATRRDWVPYFLKDFSRQIANRARLSELRPLMRRLKKHIAAHGPVSPADFQSERVPGGFNTIKASTKALEYLFLLGEVQIAGRTQNFHRLFDLTERVAPDVRSVPADWRQSHKQFFVLSAMSVLKLATPRQLSERVAHHIGPWRGGGLPLARRLVDRALEEGLLDWIEVLEDDKHHRYLALKSDLDAFAENPPAKNDGSVRLLPPLDNLLFSRRRLGELFDFSYKFEAYTPAAQRRFYFALPILRGDDLVGLIDVKKDAGAWRVLGLDIQKPVAPEELRRAVHRLGAIAGVAGIKCERRVPAQWRKVISGAVEA